MTTPDPPYLPVYCLFLFLFQTAQKWLWSGKYKLSSPPILLSILPAGLPVWSPFSTTTVPFTMTTGMPSGYWWGSVHVALSITRAASKMTRSAIASNLRGHSLAHLALCLWIDHELHIDVRVHIDQARAHRKSARIDHFLCQAVIQVSLHSHNAVSPHRNIRFHSRPPQPIVHQTSGDNEIKGALSAAVDLRPHTGCQHASPAEERPSVDPASSHGKFLPFVWKRLKPSFAREHLFIPEEPAQIPAYPPMMRYRKKRTKGNTRILKIPRKRS